MESQACLQSVCTVIPYVCPAHLPLASLIGVRVRLRHTGKCSFELSAHGMLHLCVCSVQSRDGSGGLLQPTSVSLSGSDSSLTTKDDSSMLRRPRSYTEDQRAYKQLG